MTVTIDRARALQLLEDVVAEKGADYKYEHLADTFACYYLHGDQPGCIIGHVLVKLGVPLEKIRMQEGKGASVLNWLTLGIDLKSGAREIFTEAQVTQDGSNRNWGDALAAALHAARVTP